MSTATLSVVVPVFNEASEISGALENIIAYYKDKKYFHELIVVNDGSKDNTYGLAMDFASKHPGVRALSYELNSGKGRALRTGIETAEGSHILFFDIDLAVPLDMTEKFMDAFNDPAVDIVIGTRKSKEAVVLVHQPWYREFLGKGFSLLTNYILGTKVTDVTCGFKCFKSDVAKKLFGKQKIERWGFDAEVLYLAQLAGCKVMEIPVIWQDSADSRVNLARDIVNSLVELITIRMTKYKI